VYTTNSGGAIVMETPIWAKDLAGTASITNRSARKQIERRVRIFITLPDHPSLARSSFTAAGCAD
jgi:hypothetical protein